MTAARSALTFRSLGNALRALATVTALTLIASCSDSTVLAPNAAQARLNSSQQLMQGQPFRWLAPLGTAAADPATFDGAAVSHVEVCAWTAGACVGAPVARFAIVPAVGELPLLSNAAAGRYEATLNLLNTSFVTRRTYRIRVMQGTTELGAISVDLVRGRWALTRTDGSLAPLVAANTLPVQFAVSIPPVRINEVESNGGVPGDWVELYNAGPVAVDLSGYAFKDNDNARTFRIANGTIIAPGGFLVLDESAFIFGLGASDQARLFTPSGTVVDSYTWTAHAATTYGRCPDGSGAFRTTTIVTKGSANDCSVPRTVAINEIESSGGVPGDWVELFNYGALPVDVSGFGFKDNDDTRTFKIPANTIIAPGAYLVLEEAAFGFGLGASDAARLFDAVGVLVDSYAWTSHATTSFGRCPNGTGAQTTMTTVTKGAINDCTVPSSVKINEVESNGGTPGDWVELINTGVVPVDVSGFGFKDNDDTRTFKIPANTIIAPGAYLVLDESAFVFGLGANDAARLFDLSGNVVDVYTWTAHATVTYGRCPNGTGPFTQNGTSTKSAVNDCGVVVGPPVAAAWPGLDNVTTVSGSNVFGGNLSGLMFEPGVTSATDVLWGARNGPGSVFRLTFNGTIWTPDVSNNWTAGKLLRYPSGTGEPDAEDLTFTTGSAAGMYVVAERDNSANSISRPSILRYDVGATGSTLTATNEWLLTADLPVVAANSGLEAITWVPDSYLTGNGFYDEFAAKTYNPADYTNHGTGLFFVGLEANGVVYAYALNHSNNSFQRIATFATGFPSGVMALQFDRELGQLWTTCDDTCNGLSYIYNIDVTVGSLTRGRMVRTHAFARPSSMPNINNEGFGFANQVSCAGGFKWAFWADDAETGGFSIRRASIPCTRFP